MIILRIEHRVSSYEGWKKAFDSDPINRKQSGVTRYRITRPRDDDNFVSIDLEFDNLEQASKTQVALTAIFKELDGKLTFGPQTRILNVVEETQL